MDEARNVSAFSIFMSAFPGYFQPPAIIPQKGRPVTQMDFPMEWVFTVRRSRVNWKNPPETRLQYIVIRTRLPCATKTLHHFDSDIADFFRGVLNELNAIVLIL